MRRRTRLTVLSAVSVALATASATLVAPAALAGDATPPVAVRTQCVAGADPLTGRLIVVANRPGQPAKIIGKGPQQASTLAVSASSDGRAVAYLLGDLTSAGAGIRAVVAVDGRVAWTAPPFDQNAQTFTWPTVTRDGSTAVFSVGTRLRMVNITSGHIRPACPQCRVSEPVASASLSPDRRFLAVRTLDPLTQTMRVVIYRRSDGAVVSRSSALSPGIDFAVTWRPDSREVAFTAQLMLNGVFAGHAIFAMPVGGREIQTAFRQAAVPERFVFFKSPDYWAGGVIAQQVQVLDNRVTVTALTSETWQRKPSTVPGRIADYEAGFGDEAALGVPWPWTSRMPAKLVWPVS